MAIASVVCASRLIEPKDMAPVEKRLTMSVAGSTSSTEIGLRPAASALLTVNRPRIVFILSAELFTISANSR
ncbi:hypothetical protein D3C72_2532880 [compost metagenome]